MTGKPTRFRALRHRLTAMGAGLTLLGAGLSSQAAIVTVLEANGNEVQDFSMPGQVSYDVKWHNLLPVILEIQLEPGDTQFLAYSGIHLNDSDTPFEHMRFDLPEGLIWHEVNQVRLPDDVTLSGLDHTPSAVVLHFDPDLPDRGTLLVGSPDNPLADPATDWLILVENFAEISGGGATIPGDPPSDPPAFRLTLLPDEQPNNGQEPATESVVSIPEPATLTLLGLGLAAMRRRRKRLAD